MMRKTRFIVLAVFCMTLMLLSGCVIDLEKGTVKGIVTDNLGSPMQDALVTINNATITTDANGNYVVSVTPGDHVITITKAGYTTAKETISVYKNKTITFDANLTIGITGIVTDGRGGPAVSDVSITVVGNEEHNTTTDPNGEFELKLTADSGIELIVTAENKATMRVHATQSSTAQLYLEIPTRGIFNPKYSAEPPTVSLDIEPGATLSGETEINVTVEGERPTYLIYAYLGGDHRSPRDGFFVETDTATVPVDTTDHLNGETYLKVLVYDDNENGALYIIPVNISNSITTTEVPGTLTYLEVVAKSFGQNIGFYSAGNYTLSDEYANTKYVKDIDYSVEAASEAAPEGATIMATVAWDPVEDADGYRVYRKFAGETEYSLFSELGKTYVLDYSAKLTEGKAVTYKVVPFNSAGEGTGMVRTVTPLPAFNVYLESPANDTKDVPLKPTFTWRREASSAFPKGTYFESTLSLYDGTSDRVLETKIEKDTDCSFTLQTELAPNYVYTWDIMYSWAQAVYEYDEAGLSLARSYAGEFNGSKDGTGSINGEFIFTTTSKLSD